MKLLEGTGIAQDILDSLKLSISSCVSAPGLAVILIGENKASQMYIALKEKAAQEVGVNFYDYFLHTNMDQEDVVELIRTLNEDEYIDGILVQLPLPGKYDKEIILQAIDPKKDVDGLHVKNQEKYLEDPRGYFLSPFPKAIMKLLKSSGEKVIGKEACVLANSEGFGEFMKNLLEGVDMEARYILSDDVDKNIDVISKADVIVSALGKQNCISDKMIKEGAVVIDGGIEKVDDVVCGDIDSNVISSKEGFLTPVPGGVGPVTVAYLMENVYRAAKNSGKCTVENVDE